jgi:hypothetical protein
MSVPDSACAALRDLDVPTLYYVVRRIEERHREASAASLAVKRMNESVAVQGSFRGRALEADDLGHIVRDIIHAHEQSLAPVVGAEGESQGLAVEDATELGPGHEVVGAADAPARASIPGSDAP